MSTHTQTEKQVKVAIRKSATIARSIRQFADITTTLKMRVPAQDKPERIAAVYFWAKAGRQVNEWFKVPLSSPDDYGVTNFARPILT